MAKRNQALGGQVYLSYKDREVLLALLDDRTVDLDDASRDEDDLQELAALKKRRDHVRRLYEKIIR